MGHACVFNLIIFCIYAQILVRVCCNMYDAFHIQRAISIPNWSNAKKLENIGICGPFYFFRWWSHLHMRLCVFVCGRKNWFRDYDPKSSNLCLGKSITVLLLGIAATNSVTKMKTTEYA